MDKIYLLLKMQIVGINYKTTILEEICSLKGLSPWTRNWAILRLVKTTKNFRHFCVKIYFDKKLNFFIFFWCQKKIFPGFIRFFGSKTCFIWRIRSTDFSPTSSIKNCFLPKTYISIMAPNLVPPLRSDFDYDR